MKQWNKEMVGKWLSHSHGGKLSPELAESVIANMERELATSGKYPTLGMWLIDFTEEDAGVVGVPEELRHKFIEYVKRLVTKVSAVTVQRAYRRRIGRRMIEKEKANEEYRANVAREILSTEEKYNEQLEIMVNVRIITIWHDIDLLNMTYFS